MSNSFRKTHKKIEIVLPPILLDKNVKEIRIIPKSDGRFFEIQYTYEAGFHIKETLDLNKALSIDVGINNLVTCVTDEGKSFILDGKRLKSINQWYNKNNSRLQSIRDKQKEMKTIRTGLDWPRRISLYASIDEKKEAELSALLDRELTENYGRYLESFYAGIDRLLAVHEKTVPDSRIVMGEGVSCCASPIMTFERDSGAFWKLIGNQMAYFNRQGFWGSVVATTHAPERTPAWSACRDLYREVNGVFLGKE